MNHRHDHNHCCHLSSHQHHHYHYHEQNTHAVEKLDTALMIVFLVVSADDILALVPSDADSALTSAKSGGVGNVCVWNCGTRVCVWNCGTCACVWDYLVWWSRLKLRPDVLCVHGTAIVDEAGARPSADSAATPH